jgi:hypothetical protein
VVFGAEPARPPGEQGRPDQLVRRGLWTRAQRLAPAFATAARPAAELSQFFPGAALYQQSNVIAHGALVEPRIHLLDNRRNVIVRKFRALLGETALYRIDLCPLFLRHARHPRQRTGFFLGGNWILARK